MSHILESLGLTKDLVKSMSGSKKPEIFDVNQDDKNYLYAIDQRRIRRRLESCERFITARYLEGYKPRDIAKILGVSEESVRSRLRKRKFFGKNNRPGRPKSEPLRPSKSAIQYDLSVHELSPNHSTLVETISLDPHQSQSQKDRESKP